MYVPAPPYRGFIVGVDPGVSTGLVHISPTDTILEATTAHSCDEVAEFLAGIGEGTLCVIESYAGGGHLMREGIITLETLGFAHGWAKRSNMYIRFQTPQARLAYVGQAQVALPGHEQRHMRSALAHALCAREHFEVPT
ncbi:MAG TPA: hypothetical protein VIG47_02580 [Gemmatimonadaceae bacterium]|jgi:hypothetical protein